MAPTISRISQFFRRRDGSVVVMFALLLLPMMLLVGGIMDYANARSSQADLQNTLDSAVLAGARALANDEDVEAAVRNYMKASWPTDVECPDYTVDVIDGKDVKATFSHAPVVKTAMIGMMGIEAITVKTEAVATISPPVLDVALVLDSSDSMKSEIPMLKSEANRFVEEVDSFNSGKNPNEQTWVSLNIIKRSKVDTSLWLTTNMTGPGGLKTYINDDAKVRFDGNTALGQGIQAGFGRLNSPSRCQQWSQGCGGPDPKRYLVVMSDGDEDFKFKPTSKQICPQVQAGNVTILAIAFPPQHGQKDTDNLRACAGDPNNVYWANGSKLADVFKEIIAKETRPRLKR